MAKTHKHVFESHLRSLKFPKKFKNHHELQHELLKLNPHSVAFFDEYVDSVCSGRPMHRHFYPPIHDGKSEDVELAKHYHGHTGSAISIARRHRQLVASGFGASAAKLVTKVGEKATVVGKWILKGGKKVFQKVGTLVLKAGKWVANNPKLAAELANLAINTVGMISALATGQQVKGMAVEHVTEKEISAITDMHKGAVTSLLADTDSESDDEKEPLDEKPETKKASGLQRAQSTRFMI